MLSCGVGQVYIPTKALEKALLGKTHDLFGVSMNSDAKIWTLICFVHSKARLRWGQAVKTHDSIINQHKHLVSQQNNFCCRQNSWYGTFYPYRMPHQAFDHSSSIFITWIELQGFTDVLRLRLQTLESRPGCALVICRVLLQCWLITDKIQPRYLVISTKILFQHDVERAGWWGEDGILANF